MWRIDVANVLKLAYVEHSEIVEWSPSSDLFHEMTGNMRPLGASKWGV